MKRNISLEEISDGKLYELNDLVKADCNDCKGCYSCCMGMGKSIILDPYDIFIFNHELHMNFNELLSKYIELNVVDGIILPNIKMSEKDKCSFLGENGRCSIHEFRPGMCRLFPLGRLYEDGSFKYFLQVHECKNMNRSKIKVKKWLDMRDVLKHEEYIKKWHYFLKDIEEKISVNEENFAKEINMKILEKFFITTFDEDFYGEFDCRIHDFC